MAKNYRMRPLYLVPEKTDFETGKLATEKQYKMEAEQFL
jgi:hypothetical protein